MQAAPAPIAGKHLSLGIGTGFYGGQQAMAFGAKGIIGNNISVGASMATGFGSNSDMDMSAGVGFSF